MKAEHHLRILDAIDGVQILDTTLREGEQRYGFFLPVSAKRLLAARLLEFADIIEIPSPTIAPSYEEAAHTLVGVIPRKRLLVHCTLDEKCILRAAKLGAGWVGVFIAIRQDFHHMRYNRSLKESYGLIRKVIEKSKRLGLRVRVTCEDASRTPLVEIIRFYRAALTAGADRIGYADTVGILHPKQAVRVLNALKVAGIPLSKIHVHFHNDSGFAIANAGIAIRAGVACVDGTILGLGERVGITPTEYLVSCLSRHSALAVKSAKKLVSQYVQFKPDSELRFTHKAGIHVDGVLKWSSVYEGVPPESLGLERRIVLSKLSGIRAVEYYTQRVNRSRFPSLPDPSSIKQRLKQHQLLEIASMDEFHEFLSHGT